MKRILPVVFLMAALTISAVGFGKTAYADDVKMIGSITKIEMAADKASAVVTLKDTKTAEKVLVVVADELTVDKLKDKRIVNGDEIRTKYETVDGKNVSKMFKKTAGC